MATPRPTIENNTSVSAAERDATPRLTVNDLDRPRTSTAETPAVTQPLNRERATSQLSEINDRQKVDPMRATEIARDPYRVPESQSGRQQSLQEHRESTTTTGFAGQKSYVDAHGNQMKGFESYDKNSGQRTFYGENRDGGYKPYHVQEGGKKLQPLDSNGKPSGEPVRMHGHQAEDGRPAQAFRTPDRVQQEATPQKQAEPVQHRSDSPPTPHQDVVRPQGHQEYLQGQVHQDVVRTQPAQQPARPDYVAPAAHPDFVRPHGRHDDVQPQVRPDAVRQPGRPDFVQPQVRPDFVRPHGRHDDVQPQVRPDAVRQPGRPDFVQPQVHPDFVRPHERHDDVQPQVRPDAVRQPGRPDFVQPQVHPDFVRPHGRHDDVQPQVRPDAVRQPGRPDFVQPQVHPDVVRHPGRPDFVQPQHPDAGHPPVRPDFPHLPVRPDGLHQAPPDFLRNQLRPDAIRNQTPPDAGLHPTMQGGPGLHRQFENIARSPEALKAAQDSHARAVNGLHGLEPAAIKAGDPIGRHFIDAHRIELQGHLVQNVRLNPEHLVSVAKFPGTQAGDFAGKLAQRAGAEAERVMVQNRPMDADLRARDLAGINRSVLGLEQAGRQITHLLDFLCRRELARVPDAEQSRLLIRETMRMPQMDQTANQNLAQSMQMQRFLNQRNTESGMQQESFVLKSQQVDVIRELINRIRTQDILTATGKVNDGTQGPHPNADPTIAARILDAANAANRADAARTVRDLTARDIEAARPHEVVPHSDRIPDIKTEAGKLKSEDNDTGKGGIAHTIEGKKPHDADDKHDGKKGNKDQKPDAEQVAIMLANRLKEMKQKELDEKEKQKEKVQDKDKKDPTQKTRWKYRIQKGDTLASLSERFLNDRRLAAAIFHINRTVIPVSAYEGKSFAVPSFESVIWMPSDDDIDMFNRSGVGRQYNHICFEGVKYASAQEELVARFGQRWFGPVGDAAPASGRKDCKETRRINIEKALGLSSESKETTLNELDPAERSARRANVEKILGPLKPASKQAGDRPRYNVRLGESLKSIALKHPFLKSVETWKLLAAVNDLSTETDARGCPVALLKRGMTLVLPTQSELEAFRLAGKLPGKQEPAPTLKSVVVAPCQAQVNEFAPGASL
jgi:hypothetical protein